MSVFDAPVPDDPRLARMVSPLPADGDLGDLPAGDPLVSPLTQEEQQAKQPAQAPPQPPPPPGAIRMNGVHGVRSTGPTPTPEQLRAWQDEQINASHEAIAAAQADAERRALATKLLITVAVCAAVLVALYVIRQRQMMGLEPAYQPSPDGL